MSRFEISELEKMLKRTRDLSEGGGIDVVSVIADEGDKDKHRVLPEFLELKEQVL